MTSTAWSTAASFEDLCQLTARFLSGDLDTFPGWLASELEEETQELAPVLVALNRAGLLTVASQQGHAPRRDSTGRQRARRSFVMGFACPAATALLAPLDVHPGADLCLNLYPPVAGLETDFPCETRAKSGEGLGVGGRTHRGGVLPVGILDGETFLSAGHNAAEQELEIFAQACPPAAVATLSRCTWFSAVDLAWERRSVLWDSLGAALLGPGDFSRLEP